MRKLSFFVLLIVLLAGLGGCKKYVGEQWKPVGAPGSCEVLPCDLKSKGIAFEIDYTIKHLGGDRYELSGEVHRIGANRTRTIDSLYVNLFLLNDGKVVYSERFSAGAGNRKVYKFKDEFTSPKFNDAELLYSGIYFRIKARKKSKWIVTRPYEPIK